jgi:KaiC/GvpD/RAD55 family RecA-like ATPase
MKTEKQKLLIEYLVSSPDVFALTTSIIRPAYFDPEFRNAVKFIQNYYELYNTTPDVDQVYAESDVELTKRIITKDKIEYCATEIESFCKEEAISSAILSCPDLLDKGDYGKIETIIKEAITTSLHRSLGVNFFEDPEAMMRLLIDSPAIPTGYPEFDDVLGGGLNRQQLLLLSANSGGGKSMVMANFGLNFAQRGLKVLYISLELPVTMIYRRYVSMVTGISQRDITARSSEAIQKINSAGKTIEDIIIEQMPVGSTPNDIRAFLKEFELKRGYIPDVLIVDYLDLMNPNEKVSADNVFEKDKRSTEQLRQILVDYDMIGITASQQNRGAVTATDLNHSHIAGGISKINTTDTYASIIFTDAMKAAGEMAIQFLKTRSSDGVGKTIHLKWNRTWLRLENNESSKPSLVLTKKSPLNINPDTETSNPSSSLLDMMDL